VPRHPRGRGRGDRSEVLFYDERNLQLSPCHASYIAQTTTWMDFFAVFTRCWSNLLQFSPHDHLINYLSILIEKLLVWHSMTMLQLMYTNLKQKIQKVNHSFINYDFFIQSRM
jgi:hypothetical protein